MNAKLLSAAVLSACLLCGAGCRRSEPAPDVSELERLLAGTDRPVVDVSAAISSNSAAEPAAHATAAKPAAVAERKPAARGTAGEKEESEEEGDAEGADDAPQGGSGNLAEGSAEVVAPGLSGTREEKLVRLRALSARRARRAAGKADEAGERAGAGEGADAPSDPSDPEGPEFVETVNLVGDALEDPDPEVRDQALSMLGGLTYEESNVLSLRVLDGNDALLKERLVDAAAAADDEFSATILMHALDDASASVRSKADAGLREKFSQSFSSSEEALAWWERNHETIMGAAGAEGSRDASDGAEGEFADAPEADGAAAED